MRLDNHSGEFDASDFLSAYERDYHDCKEAYDDYIEHISELLVSLGLENVDDVEEALTADGLPVLDFVVAAVSNSDLAAGALYTGNNDDYVTYTLADRWDLPDEAGITGEYLVHTIVETDLENYINALV